jgi:hypothetical protein
VRERIPEKVYLGRLRACAGKAIRAGEFAVEIVEAVVLEVDDDDVLQPVRPSASLVRLSALLAAAPFATREALGAVAVSGEQAARAKRIPAASERPAK